MLFVCSHWLYLLFISSTKLLKVICTFLHGCFSVMGFILVAADEILNLSGALVSHYVSYKAANLERISASGIADILLYLSIIRQVLDRAAFISLI